MSRNRWQTTGQMWQSFYHVFPFYLVMWLGNSRVKPNDKFREVLWFRSFSSATFHLLLSLSPLTSPRLEPSHCVLKSWIERSQPSHSMPCISRLVCGPPDVDIFLMCCFLNILNPTLQLSWLFSCCVSWVLFFSWIYNTTWAEVRCKWAICFLWYRYRNYHSNFTEGPLAPLRIPSLLCLGWQSLWRFLSCWSTCTRFCRDRIVR
jgi:hypothetical protein